MLQSLLPGFRHIRAPLISGYIWLLGLWLVFREITMNQADSLHIRRDIVELANWAGKPATLAALTLIAYLVGTLSMAATRLVSMATRLLKNTRLEWLVSRYWLDKHIEDTLEESVDRRLAEHYLDDEQFRRLLTNHLSECRHRALTERRQLFSSAQELPDVASLERRALEDEFTRWRLINALVNKGQYVESAKEDVGHLAYRLLGKEEQVYAEYDRVRSEGTFRSSVVLPLAFLCLTLSFIESWWWLAGLGAPFVFAYLAGGSFSEAERGLISAVFSGRVDLPSLERIRTRDVVLEPYDMVAFDEITELPPPYLPQLPRPWYARLLGR